MIIKWRRKKIEKQLLPTITQCILMTRYGVLVAHGANQYKRRAYIINNNRHYKKKVKERIKERERTKERERKKERKGKERKGSWMS
jgi:hypothetical protein